MQYQFSEDFYDTLRGKLTNSISIIYLLSYKKTLVYKKPQDDPLGKIIDSGKLPETFTREFVSFLRLLDNLPFGDDLYKFTFNSHSRKSLYFQKKKGKSVHAELEFLHERFQDPQFHPPDNQELLNFALSKIGSNISCSEKAPKFILNLFWGLTFKQFCLEGFEGSTLKGVLIAPYRSIGGVQLFSNDQENIVRQIDFEPEHFQAGIDILNYFGTILHEKFPDVDNKVVIEQKGLAIRMVITTPSGHRKVVERTLEEYGEVILGRKRPEQFLDTRIQILRLENKLEIALAQTNMAMQQLEFERKTHSRNILNLEVDNNYLRKQLGDSLSHNRETESNHAELVASLVEQFGIVYQDSNTNFHMIITAVLELNKTDHSEIEIREALVDLRKRSPKLFGRVSNFLEKVGAGTSTHMLWEIIQNL